MIGLKRHIVQIVDHNPGWADLAVQACKEVRKGCGDLVIDVEHVGSTAVTGLCAKPILDLAAAVTALRVVPELIKALTAIGYIYCGDQKGAGWHLFVREREPGVRTIHLHVIAIHTIEWRNYLRFRDILRQDEGIRKRYATLKQKLGNRFSNDRKSYTDSKHDFIQDVLN